MTSRKSFSFAIAAFTALCLISSCQKEEQGGGGGGGDDPGTITEINGTKILEGNNAVGLVSDINGNGIAGIPVTDGYSYTVTDKNGVYQMEASRYCRIVYLSLPAGYKVPVDASTHMPLFYSTKAFDKKKVNRNDFKLEPQAVEENFTLIMIGDPQCENDKEVSRYSQETVPDIQATLNAAPDEYVNPYAITLGDVTFDSYGTWDGMKKSMSNVKLQNGKYLNFFQCIGNHDHNSKVNTEDYEATQKFFDVFGPTDYSFDRGQAHIIVMDDIMVTNRKSNSSPNGGTWAYNAGLSTLAYKWLQSDINQVKDKENKLVFLCMHIPMRGGSNSGGSNINKDKYYSEMLALLKQFKEAHIMIGHTHYPQNWIHTGQICKGGKPIYEHIHGAACGGWWSCNSNVTGAPNGFSLYKIKGNTVENWVAKGTNRKATYQMRAYNGNQLLTGTKGYPLYWYNTSQKAGSNSITVKGNVNFQNCIIAEIWDDDESNWKVEMYKDGAKVGDFQRIPNGGSCNVAIANYFFNELGKNTDTWTSTTASHYWYFNVGDPAAYTGWDIKATQTIPSSGVQNHYSVGVFTTGNGEF